MAEPMRSADAPVLVLLALACNHDLATASTASDGTTGEPAPATSGPPTTSGPTASPGDPDATTAATTTDADTTAADTDGAVAWTVQVDLKTTLGAGALHCAGNLLLAGGVDRPPGPELAWVQRMDLWVRRLNRPSARRARYFFTHSAASWS